MDIINPGLMMFAGTEYCCSQIMTASALSIKGDENPQLIHAMKALCGGIKSGLTCGALTGGACFLMILHAEAADEMIQELTRWFQEHYETTACDLLTDGRDPQIKAERCPSIVSSVYDKCLELLEINGYQGN